MNLHYWPKVYGHPNYMAKSMWSSFVYCEQYCSFYEIHIHFENGALFNFGHTLFAKWAHISTGNTSNSWGKALTVQYKCSWFWDGMSNKLLKVLCQMSVKCLAIYNSVHYCSFCFQFLYNFVLLKFSVNSTLKKIKIQNKKKQEMIR